MFGDPLDFFTSGEILESATWFILSFAALLALLAVLELSPFVLSAIAGVFVHKESPFDEGRLRGYHDADYQTGYAEGYAEYSEPTVDDHDDYLGYT